MHSLVPVLEELRGWIAANSPTMTRDAVILEELVKAIRARVHDASGDGHRFALREAESPVALRARIDALVAASTGEEAATRPEAARTLLDDASLARVVGRLQDLDLAGAGRDVIGEAFETLVFPSIRGGQGQFFTPQNVARCLVELLEPAETDRVIDPAVGTGGFLVEVARRLARRGCPDPAAHLVGVDKDSMLAGLAHDNLRLRFGGGTVATGSSLVPHHDQPEPLRTLLEPGRYDVVIANPPFGARLPVRGPAVLGAYDLGHRWAAPRKEEAWHRTDDLRPSAPPQELFVEACWRLLREGGRCGIVLPEGLLGNRTAGFLRQWLLERADLLAVIDCPVETFMPSTSTKTAMIVFERRARPRRPAVFMAVPERCGHDRRGGPLTRDDGTPDDDFPAVVDAWRAR